MGSLILRRVAEIFLQNLEIQRLKHTMEQIVILYYTPVVLYLCETTAQ
jgi:hypothetical protein